jgi:hypothetical protein
MISPITLLGGLDESELSLLPIKPPLEVTGFMLLDIVLIANRSCQLRNLTEFAMAGGDVIKSAPV